MTSKLFRVAVAGALVAGVLGWFGGALPVWAAQGFGQLDRTFGDAGVVTADLGDAFEQVNALVVQPDGKVVVAGPSDRGVYLEDRFTLLRYNADGSPDASFGDGGRVIGPIVAELEYDFGEVFALALQPDGKILAAGTAQNPEMFHRTVAVARYNADGSLDRSFGTGGATITAVDPETGYGRQDDARAIALAPDGKIVVAGLTGAYILDTTVLRFNANGTPDTTFGDGGKVVIDLGGYDQVNAVLVQPDGKIVVGGSGQNTVRDFTLLRFNVDGSFDSGFGQDGRVATDFVGGEDLVYGLALRPDGKIIAGGSAQNYSSSSFPRYVFALAQYNPDGSLDPGFGVDGKAFYDLGVIYNAGAYALVRRADGKLVLAGHLGVSSMAVGLYNPDGTPDNRFDGDGLATVSFGEGGSSAYAVAVQPDGKIVVGGMANMGGPYETNQNFALARFLAPAVSNAAVTPTATPTAAPTATPGSDDATCESRLPPFLSEYLRRLLCGSDQ